MGCDYWKVKQAIIEYYLIQQKPETIIQTKLDLRVTPMFFENDKLAFVEREIAEEDNEYIRDKKMKQAIKSLFEHMSTPDPIVIYNNGAWNYEHLRYKTDIINHIKSASLNQPVKIVSVTLHEYYELP